MNTELSENKSAPTYIKVQKNLQRIVVDDIVYLKSNDDHVQIVFNDSSILQPRITLKKLLAQLPAENFIQIHRSYAVAIPAIHTVSADVLEIAGQKLPIGRLYKATLKQTLRKVSLQIV